MTDTIQSLIRSVLKIGGGMLVAQGLANQSEVEVIISGILALIAVIWGVLHRAPSKSSGSSGSIAGGTSRLLLLAGLGLTAGLGVGCAHFSTSQKEVAPDGTERTTTVSAVSLWDSKNTIANLHTTQTGKSQGVGIGSIENESSSTNLTQQSANVLKGLEILGGMFK